MKKINPLLFLPGIAIWGLFGVGFATDNMTLVGISACLMAATVVVGLAVQAKRSSAKRAEDTRIWLDGTPAKAKVIDISTKGGGLNDNPLIDIQLDVTPEGEASYRALTSVIVNMLAVPRIQPGCEIDVRFDPKDRTKVVIDEKLTYLGYKS
jgi:hypothetical protein